MMILSYVSDLDEQEQYQHDLDIEIAPHENLDSDPYPTPNQWPKPKWAQKLIEAVGDGAGNPEDRRRTWSQYQNEHVTHSHAASLSTQRCNKLLGKCYLMITNDLQFGPLKNKIDHSIPPPKRRDKGNIPSPIYHHIGRRCKSSHAQSQDVDEWKNHDFAWLIH